MIIAGDDDLPRLDVHSGKAATQDAELRCDALANRRDQVIGVDDARGQFADVCEQPLQPLAFAQGVLHAFALGDVRDRAHPADHATRRIRFRRADDVNPSGPASRERQLDLVLDVLTGERAIEIRSDFGERGVADDFVHRAADDLVNGHADQAPVGGIHGLVSQVARDADEAGRGRIEKALQGRFGAPVLRRFVLPCLEGIGHEYQEAARWRPRRAPIGVYCCAEPVPVCCPARATAAGL